MHVEQAFGIRVNKWSLLESPSAFNLEDSTGASIATARLHKISLDFGAHTYEKGPDMEM